MVTGVSWTKPRLGVAEWNGTRENNIVWPLVSNSSTGAGGAFEDTKPGTPPSERWKMLVSCSHGTWPLNRSCKHMALLASGDGLRWRPLFPDASLRFHSDTCKCISF